MACILKTLLLNNFNKIKCVCLCVAGTLHAAIELMKKQQAEILGCMVIIELKELNAIDKLKPHSVFSLLQY